MSADEDRKYQEIILQALSQVREPGGKSLQDAGLLAGIRGEGAELIITCKDPGIPDPIKQRLAREAQSAVQAKMPQIERVQLEWGTAGTTGAPEAPNVRHVVAVGSGKGGVGKSTIAASLAYALHHRGFRVGLMDADVYGPSIPHMLGLQGRPPVANNKYQPLEKDGLKVISMGFLVPPNQAVVWRGPMLHKAVRDFIYSVEWGTLDYLIVDLPPGTGDVVLSLSQQMPISGGVIVCTPQDVALLDAKKALNMLQTVKIPCRGVVENMSFFLCPNCGSRSEIFGHGGAKHWAEEAGVPFLGGVPINLQVRLNGDAGKVGDNFLSANPARDQLLAIADRLVAEIEADETPTVPTLEIV
jgi:ATP-binding protein involved in chromosome partitioning